jgi:hypothetical protein
VSLSCNAKMLPLMPLLLERIWGCTMTVRMHFLQMARLLEFALGRGYDHMWHALSVSDAQHSAFAHLYAIDVDRELMKHGRVILLSSPCLRGYLFQPFIIFY